MQYVYVLKSTQTRFLYVGVTTDLRARVQKHNSKQSRDTFTRRHAPWKLVFYEAYLSRADAVEREMALKKYGSSLAQLKKRIRRSIECAG